MNLATVMQEIADRLDTITGLRVYAYPPDNVQPPAAVVSYPETYTFDEAFARGMDRIPDLPVVVLVGRVSDRASRDRIAGYVDGSGVQSIKAVLEVGAGQPIAFTSGSRTSDVVTLFGLPVGHGIQIGQYVQVDAADDSYDGIFTVTGFDGSAVRIQYSQVAANDPASGAGTVRVIPYTAFDTLRVTGVEFDIVSDRKSVV